MSSKAFVTLLTTPSYLPGVLVLLHSLLDLHPSPRDFKTVCLVTPQTVDARTIKEVRQAGFDLVIGVEPIGSGVPGEDALSLMGSAEAVIPPQHWGVCQRLALPNRLRTLAYIPGRPDLNLALTKLHLFRLSTLFSTLIYLDADVLPLRPLDHLFDSTAPHVLSACPDTGWPDCFNSGVMVIRPKDSDFAGLQALLKNGTDAEEGTKGSGNGSFDGADQGLLNEWFSSEGGGEDWNRLSFTYNVTPTAAYQYAPAYKRFGHKINAVHFIGPSKPWSNLQWRPAGISNVQGQEAVYDYPALIDRWYSVYDKHIRPSSAHAPDMVQRFTVPETRAVWDSPTANQPSDRMDLEALKSATAKGFTGLQGGQYTSMPLEGRVDLIMPVPPPKPRAKQVSWGDSLSAPGAPALPHPGDPVPIELAQSSQPPSTSTQIHHPTPHHAQHHHQQQQHQQQQSRPPPPPPSMWDAQRYSPPKEGKPEMGNTQINYYENAWDAPPQSQSQYFAAPAPHSEPQYPTLPRNVVEDKWYEKYTGGSAPDQANVQAVFPWEGKKDQRKPDRVFPRASSPPPRNQAREGGEKNQFGHVNVSVSAPTPPPSSPQPPPRQEPPKPISMDEAMASYTNAWDDDFRIQRYIAHITGVPLKEKPKAPAERLQSVPGTPRLTASQGPLQNNFSHETRSSASGDGDDEDEGEDEDDGDDPQSSPRAVMRRNKDVKLPSWSGTYSSNPKYRDRQSQTDRREMNDVGAQVSGQGVGASPVIRTVELPGVKGGRKEISVTYPAGAGVGAGAGLGLQGGVTNGTSKSVDNTSRPSAPTDSLGPSSATTKAARRMMISQPSTDKIPRRIQVDSPTAYVSTLPTGVSPTSQSGFAVGGYGGTGGTAKTVSTVSNPIPQRQLYQQQPSSSFAQSQPQAQAQHQLQAGGPPSISVRRPSSDVSLSHHRRESIESTSLDPAGNPKVPASRTFDPSTDLEVRKRQTQEVLTRFIRGTEAGQ